MAIAAGVILPVYNVEKTIAKVLDAITSTTLAFVAEILIVDNASEDRTVDLIHECLRRRPDLAQRVTLILNKQNYGYGCSIKTGFQYFLDQPVSHVLVIHGDYQVDPDRIMSDMFQTLRYTPLPDVVLASRFTPESDIRQYSPLRKLGNYFFNALTYLCTGFRMSDAGTAMMMARKEALRGIPISDLSNSWQFHPQLNILLFSEPAIRTKEIAMDWADSEAKSTVPLFRYGWQLSKMLVRYCLVRRLMKRQSTSPFPVDPIREDRSFSFALVAAQLERK